jgi:hypothetical protein
VDATLKPDVPPAAIVEPNSRTEHRCVFCASASYSSKQSVCRRFDYVGLAPASFADACWVKGVIARGFARFLRPEAVPLLAVRRRLRLPAFRSTRPPLLSRIPSRVAIARSMRTRWAFKSARTRRRLKSHLTGRTVRPYSICRSGREIYFRFVPFSEQGAPAALYAALAFLRRSAHLFFIISESRLRPSGVSLCLRLLPVDFPGGRPLLVRGEPMFPIAAMARSIRSRSALSSASMRWMSKVALP